MRRSAFLVAAAALAACAGPAAAFDCATARSPLDKALCASPALKSADDAMAAAWKTAHDSAAGADRDMLLASQRAWIKRRADICDQAEQGYVACQIADTEARRNYLASRPETGPGLDSPMKPALVVIPGRKGNYDVDVELTRFAEPKTPGEKTLNAEVAKLVADVPKDTKDIGKDEIWSYARTMRVVYASPHLISARIEGYDFTGGAHGNPLTWGLNIDVPGGRKLAFADAFDHAAAQKLEADCAAQVLKQKKERLGDLPTGDDLKAFHKDLHNVFADLGAWDFSTRGASIVFANYAVGAYAEGQYTCEFPLAKLKELAKATFPLPQ
jgi:uncharacterized protein YecT (DUF1311 family)